MSTRSKSARQSSQAYLMLIASMLIFGTIGIFRRYIPLSSGMLACARGLMGAAVLAAFVKLRGGRIRHGIGWKKVLLLGVTGGIMGANWILLFEAYNYTTVPVATLCYYMQPTIVVFLSPLLFGERITPKKLGCALVSILGMVLVAGVADGGSIRSADVTGILLGLGAAVLYATVIILNKKVQIADDYEKTILQLLSAAIVMAPYLLLTEDFSALRLDVYAAVMLAVVGLVHTGLAYALYFSSMRSLKAQTIAMLSYIDPVSSLILSALILHEQLTVYGLIGAVCIIGAALISEKG